VAENRKNKNVAIYILHQKSSLQPNTLLNCTKKVRLVREIIQKNEKINVLKQHSIKNGMDTA
jgi:hypothetical protein